jgi:hypothetical protein
MCSFKVNAPAAVAVADDVHVLTAAARQLHAMASHRIALCALALLACASIAQAASVQATIHRPDSPKPKNILARWEQCGGAGELSCRGT